MANDTTTTTSSSPNHLHHHLQKFEVTAVFTSGSPSDQISLESRRVYRKSQSQLITKLFEWSPPLWLEKIVISAITPVLTWLIAYLLLKDDALPGGQTFALLILIFLGIATGYALELIKLPPLLGMLFIGIAMRNTSGFQFCQSLSSPLSSSLRQLALIVILTRAGLGLDPLALRKLSSVVLRLAFGPCLIEALTLAITTHFILGYPWAWGFLLGFVISAVSPAVTVPCLLSLRDRGYGVAKGIPTIVIAAASVDDILAISAFGVTLSFAVHSNQQESLTMTIIQGPIEVLLGITFGLLWGLLCGIFLSRPGKEAELFRTLFIFGGGSLAVFGFQFIGYAGSGALGCLTASFIASVLWRQKNVLEDNDNLNWAFQKLWFIFQPLLFGLIGCEIDLLSLKPNVILLGLLCLGIALIFRIITSFYMVARAGLTFKETLFIAMAWLPKATVQAAIGSVAYDLARELNAGAEAEEYGLQVLTIAVLSILITAPVGAIAIMWAGPKLLEVGEDSSLEEERGSGGGGGSGVGVTDTKSLTGNFPKMGVDPSFDTVLLNEDEETAGVVRKNGGEDIASKMGVDNSISES